MRDKIHKPICGYPTRRGHPCTRTVDKQGDRCYQHVGRVPPGPKATDRRNRGLTHPQKIKEQERIAQAVELRKTGITFARIADVLGYASASSAYNAVMGAIRKMVREPTEELIALEEERLDALFAAAYPQAKRGVMTAIDRCLKIMERRAKLKGLDMPSKIDVTWQEELRRRGVEPSEAFEGMVQYFYEIIADDAAD